MGTSLHANWSWKGECKCKAPWSHASDYVSTFGIPLSRTPLVVHCTEDWVLLQIVGSNIQNLRRLLSTYQDLTFCKEYDLIRRFPYGVRTKFTDFEFSTENNVIKRPIHGISSSVKSEESWHLDRKGVVAISYVAESQLTQSTTQ